ncbi:hypothetical protein vseg_000326 [Gypsophila vaccaria]
MAAFPFREVVLPLKQDTGSTKYLVLMTSKIAQCTESTDGIYNPKCKFTVENSSTFDGMVHLRASNNKYLVREGNDYALTFTSESPVEDKSSVKCTLLRAIRTREGNQQTVKFVHAQLERDVGRYPPYSGPPGNSLGVRASGMLPTDFVILDYNKIMILPKRIAFKKPGGNFIGHRYIKNNNYNPYIEGEVGEETVEYHIHRQRHNQDIKVQSVKAQRFWKLSTSSERWITSEETYIHSTDPRTMFEVVKAGPNKISLRNRGNRNFCIGHTSTCFKDCLSARGNSMIEAAQIEVGEPLVERTIRVKKFNLEDARIFNHEDVAYFTRKAINNGTTPDIFTVDFSDTVTDTSTWSNSQSLDLAVKFGFTAGFPKIGLGFEVSVHGEYSEEYEWGQKVETVRKIEASHTVSVPAKTTRVVKMIVKAASCEIPFSYTQADRYTNGDWEVTYVQDGLYTGTNAYSFYFETIDQPLQSVTNFGVADTADVSDLDDSESESAFNDSESGVVDLPVSAQDDSESALVVDDDDGEDYLMSATLVATEHGVIDTAITPLPPLDNPVDDAEDTNECDTMDATDMPVSAVDHPEVEKDIPGP